MSSDLYELAEKAGIVLTTEGSDTTFHATPEQLGGFAHLVLVRALAAALDKSLVNLHYEGVGFSNYSVKR